MKFKKRILGAIVLAMALIFCGSVEVHAEKYDGAIWPSEYISNVYIKKQRPDGYIKYQQGAFIRRSEDNKFVYCLQPYVDINNNYQYNVTTRDYAAVLNISEESWQKIALYAYYGYGYGNHTDHKWYAITQVLIWRMVEPDSQIYFTDSLNGTRNDNLFKSEIAELEALVAKHKTKPSFDIASKTVNIGSEFSLTDKNGVLNDYTVSVSNSMSVVNKSGNKLTLKANAIGAGRITFRKTSNLYDSDPVLYYATGTQNVFRVGNVDPITMSLDFEIIGGKVTLHKLDRDNGTNTPSGEATLEGAVYGIFDNTGKKVGEIKTALDGTVQSDYLPNIGEFFLKEQIASVGYTVDGEEHWFSVTPEQLFPDVTVYEQVIKRPIRIRKFFANGDTGKLMPEKDVVFEFYDKNNKMVARVETDEDGAANLNLPYGTYIGKQITTTQGHEKVEDFKVTINEDSPEVINLAFSNAPIQAKLKVIKIDEETGNIIPRSGITFKIFDVDNNKYVCQTISYPKAETLCEFKTDEDGILYTPYELNTGRYRLEEVDQVIDGYVWNKTSKEFSIDENSDFINDDVLGVIFEVQFANKQVKGKIKINKLGEAFILEDGYEYKEISLENVEFEIYANEDIIIGGKEYYKKGDLVDTIYTDEDGAASLDNLPLGKYLLVEKKTDENHVLLEEPIEFEIEYKDQYTEKVIKEFDIKNIYKKGTLEFTKTDLVDGTPIPGVEICIYTEDDELVYCGETNEQGQIVITDLPVNTPMYIIETRAADNYQITDEKVFFTILENGEVVKASLTNERIIIEVPNTGLNETYFVEIVSGLLILCGMGGIVYAIKKKRK